MSRLDSALARVKNISGGKMWERLRYEMRYARRVSQALNGKHEELVLGAIESAIAAAEKDGVVTEQAALEIENSLLPMQADCKKYILTLCGHAHIDMNWMWRYDETVQITLDTFRTVLELMREFPEFTFSQSQASVYHIVEEFAPDMLEEIRAREKEGRWEVTASTWVEPDRNMGSYESIARHHLYTRRYIESLGMKPSVVDFEPDTFGHHQNMPEILNRAGIKYFYHCRGLNGQTLYRFRAPSGDEVLGYREPFWYNDTITGDFAEYAPEFCEKFGVERALRVYGVGDHGGGPTRRDIRRIVDMQSWPIYATVEFGTFHRFFDSAAKATKEIPVVDRELNAIFVGCYTTQTRIKKGNRYGERMMGEAEQMNAFAAMAAGAAYRKNKFAEGWRNVMFNQFHDILPGSGVTDTREYAMGLYQQTYAVANTARRLSMKAIADRIDTSAIRTQPFDNDISTGAGVGFRVEESLNPAPVEFGLGKTRIFHLFNGCAFDRDEVTELIVWDMKADEANLCVKNDKGESLPYQVIESGYNDYWGHSFTRVLVKAAVPAMGYATCVIEPKEDIEEPIPLDKVGPTVEVDEDWSLENDCLEVICDPAENDGAIIVTEKDSGEVHVIDGFHYVIEDEKRGMSAWTTGDPITDERLTAIRMKRTVKGALYNELEATVDFGEKSQLVYTIGLKAGMKRVDISAKCRWLEPGIRAEQTVPQLRFTVMADDSFTDEYTYDIPGGLIRRGASAQELPGIRFIADGRMMLMSDCKYGYRGAVGQMGLTLIRSAYEPDEFPELGNHTFRVSLGFADSDEAMDLTRMAAAFQSDILNITGRSHEGELPAEQSFARVESGTVELTAIKQAEDSSEIIIRGVEMAGDGRNVRIALKGAISASFTDTHEREDLGDAAVENGVIAFDARPYGLFVLKVKTEK